jgi:hypothetical protein
MAEGSGLTSGFDVTLPIVYPHALVGRLNGESDFSAGYATFNQLVRTQLLTLSLDG